jgi:hypothetical protein
LVKTIFAPDGGTILQPFSIDGRKELKKKVFPPEESVVLVPGTGVTRFGEISPFGEKASNPIQIRITL